jgi:hypothetical protein
MRSSSGFSQEQGMRKFDRLLERHVLRDDVLAGSAISSGRGNERLSKLLLERPVSVAGSKAALVAQTVGGVEQTGRRRRGATIRGEGDRGEERHEDVASRPFGRKYKIQALAECCPGLRSAAPPELREAERVERARVTISEPPR